MKKIGVFVSIILIIGLLVSIIAVSKIDVLKSSGILDDEDYQKYLEIKNNGENNIKYLDPNKIRVSFATNKSLEVEYYYDKSMTERITETAYLIPGDTIYIKLIDTNSIHNNLYKFSRYEVYALSDEFGRERIVKLEDAETFFTIPENHKGKEIQIIPLGEYSKDTIKLLAVDENNKEIISGIWKNNDTEIDDDFLSLGPSEDFKLTYSYNTKEFFFIGSYPEHYYHDNENGVVTFASLSSSNIDKPTEYVVELMRFLTLNLKLDKYGKIMLNDTVIENKTKKYEFNPQTQQLKFGDKIKIETEGNIQVTEGDYKYIDISSERNSSTGLNIYIIGIDESNSSKTTKEKLCTGADIVEDVTITFPNKDQYGTAKYTINSKEITGTQTLKEGDKVKIEYKITKNGYIFSKQNIFDKLFNSKSKIQTIEISADKNNTTLDLSELFKVEKEDKK